MAIGITELMNAIGDDRIEFQLLDNCMTNIRSANRHATISFKTEALSATDVATGGGKMAFIVWIDRDVLSAEIEKLKSGAVESKGAQK